jgi:hypothetical protein
MRLGEKGHATDIALTIMTVRSWDTVVLRVGEVEDTPAYRLDRLQRNRYKEGVISVCREGLATCRNRTAILPAIPSFLRRPAPYAGWKDIAAQAVIQGDWS